MAIAPLSIDLPAALRGTGFVPFYTPAPVVQSPVNAFTRILETSAATGAPLPAAQALARAVPAADTQTVLDRSYFRDLIAGLGQPQFPGAAVQGPSAVTQSFGIEALLGRNGLPQAHAYDLVYRHGLDVSPDGAMIFIADGNRGTDLASHRVRRVMFGDLAM